MSEHHEMQFADPAWQPGAAQNVVEGQANPAPQPIWTPPPDMGVPGAMPQAATSEQEYTQGYRGQFGPNADHEETFQAPPQQAPFQYRQQQPFFQFQQPWYSRVPIWAWIVIAIVIISSIFQSISAFGAILLLGICCVIGWLIYNGRLRVKPQGETQAPETRTFEVGAHPTLVINNKAGAVRVRAGQEGQVSITTTRRGYLFDQHPDSDVQITYNQDQASNRVTARVEAWKAMGKNATIDFEIVVPPQSNLELLTNAGILAVQDIDGQMTLRSNAGTIDTSRVILRGQSQLDTNAGSITFVGALDLAGDYKLSTNLGTIDATLPADASFNLKAKTDLGTVSTNFPLAQSQMTRAYGQVGSGPYPRLQIKTNLGTIAVHRQ